MCPVMSSTRKETLLPLVPAWFVDPLSPVFGATSAVAVGALGLIDPSRLSPARRRAYWVAMAGSRHGGRP